MQRLCHVTHVNSTEKLMCTSVKIHLSKIVGVILLLALRLYSAYDVLRKNKQ